MILKMKNADKNFYQYMGKYFGSRIVQKQTSDRIYDDNTKQWYIDIEDDKAVAFVSVHKNVIKNVYGIKDNYIEAVLTQIIQENQITNSVVTSCYVEIYRKCGFKVAKNESYKNFVTISVDK